MLVEGGTLKAEALGNKRMEDEKGRSPPSHEAEGTNRELSSPISSRSLPSPRLSFESGQSAGQLSPVLRTDSSSSASDFGTDNERSLFTQSPSSTRAKKSPSKLSFGIDQILERKPTPVQKSQTHNDCVKDETIQHYAVYASTDETMHDSTVKHGSDSETSDDYNDFKHDNDHASPQRRPIRCHSKFLQIGPQKFWRL
ncbi:hypothetical protein BaRGS_00029597 [Batillaria attramentaria]|uniref:Uncharacterized protein n=1 Tax=Batillaria attramentaria TaxID=370345 RepID=A0ABD0JWR9_9CAEN